MIKSDKEKIKIFTQEVLGCECPEEVFEYIEDQKNIELENKIRLSHKINIGNRLLIYISEANDLDFIKGNLKSLVMSGKNERDRKGFNRFRLVVLTDNIDLIENHANTIFANLSDHDEKLHLHIIDNVTAKSLL